MHHLTGLEFENHVPQEERDEMIHEAIEELETDEAFQEIDPGALRFEMAKKLKGDDCANVIFSFFIGI